MTDATTNQSPDRALWTDPKWRPEDLGLPLPRSAHANSVCLPCWQDVIDYEEKKPRVIKRLQAGYPRFVVPEPCARLFERARQKLGRPGEFCHLYPTRRSAERCAAQLRHWCGVEARVMPWPAAPVHAVLYPSTVEQSALKHWRHTGDGISSRPAEAILAGNMEFAIDQQQYLQGYLPIVFATLFKLYGLSPTGVVMTGPGFVTKDNAQQVIDLSKQGIR